MKDIKEMLGELTDEELQDAKCFIESELVVRSDCKVTEKVQKLANMIQQIVDLDYTLSVGSIYTMLLVPFIFWKLIKELVNIA